VTLTTPDYVNSVVLLTDDWYGQFDGPLQFARDGGQFEVHLPIDDPELDQSVAAEQASSMTEWDERIFLAFADGEVVAHGTTSTIAHAYGGDRELVIVADSSQYVNASDLDIDPEGVRADGE